MSIKVNSIDDIGIKERLKKDGSPLSKEALQLIAALERALKGQQDVTAMALKKLREQAKEESLSNTTTNR